jgi:hypothetical protein
VDLDARLNRARLQPPAPIPKAAQAILRKHSCLEWLEIQVASPVRIRTRRPSSTPVQWTKVP